MSAWLKVMLGLGAVLLLLCAAALYLFTWPFRMSARAAGLRPPKRRGRALSAALFESTLALALSAFGLYRSRAGRIGPSWHPCEECGAPIDRPSTARYCSQACLRSSRIRQRAALERVAHYE